MESPQDSLKLLRAYDLPKKEIIKYNDRNKKIAIKGVINTLKEKDAVYISSAGTPGISDPGADLVGDARKNGIEVSVIPGPSALACAIAMSGMRLREFMFVSFPPKKPGQLRNFFKKFHEQKTAVIFFESTHRIIKTIEAVGDVVPEAQVFVAKEMTKMFEKYFSGTSQEVLGQLKKDPKNIKGEFTVIVNFE